MPGVGPTGELLRENISQIQLSILGTRQGHPDGPDRISNLELRLQGEEAPLTPDLSSGIHIQ